MYVCVLCVYLVPMKVRRGFGFHGTELTDDCEPLCGARFSGRAASLTAQPYLPYS